MSSQGLLADSGFGRTTRLSEQQVKAAYLINLSNFTSWPQSAFSGPQAPLELCLLEPDPFDGLLERLATGIKVDGHPLKVRVAKSDRDIERCHLLYLDTSQNNPNLTLLQHLSGKPVLTVSDDPDFLDRGGMVALVKKRKKIRLEIDPEWVRAQNLGLSAKLMQVAKAKSGRRPWE